MSNPENNHLLCETLGAAAIISINRARQRNTLSIATLNQLISLFESFRNKPEIAIIVLTGLGEAFAAGADINELLALTTISAVDFSQLGGRLFNAIRTVPQIVIAAIDGFCMGGGLDLALACDLRYASKDAVFAHPGANIGIITGFGGTRRLPDAIGRHHAEQLFATAERIDSRRALEIGLVQAYAHDCTALEFARQRAQIFAKYDQQLLRQLKKIIYIAAGSSSNGRRLLAQRMVELETNQGAITRPDSGLWTIE